MTILFDLSVKLQLLDGIIHSQTKHDDGQSPHCIICDRGAEQGNGQGCDGKTAGGIYGKMGCVSRQQAGKLPGFCL